jgi:fucose permease
MVNWKNERFLPIFCHFLQFLAIFSFFLVFLSKNPAVNDGKDDRSLMVAALYQHRFFQNKHIKFDIYYTIRFVGCKVKNVKFLPREGTEFLTK